MQPLILSHYYMFLFTCICSLLLCFPPVSTSVSLYYWANHRSPSEIWSINYLVYKQKRSLEPAEFSVACFYKVESTIVICWLFTKATGSTSWFHQPHWVWWRMPTVPALSRLNQEMVSSRTASTTQQDLASEQTKITICTKHEYTFSLFLKQ